MATPPHPTHACTCPPTADTLAHTAAQHTPAHTSCCTHRRPARCISWQHGHQQRCHAPVSRLLQPTLHSVGGSVGQNGAAVAHFELREVRGSSVPAHFVILRCCAYVFYYVAHIDRALYRTCVEVRHVHRCTCVTSPCGAYNVRTESASSACLALAGSAIPLAQRAACLPCTHATHAQGKRRLGGAGGGHLLH